VIRGNEGHTVSLNVPLDVSTTVIIKNESQKQYSDDILLKIISVIVSKNIVFNL